MKKILRVSWADYERLGRINWSTLKHLARSPAHYRHALLEEPADTDAKKRGRATHIAVFEPDRFRSACVRWEGARRYGKEWEAFCAEHAGREILTDDMYTEALAIGAAARADKEASRFLEKGRAEQTLLWTHRGLKEPLEAKGRIDFLAEWGAIVDLKTTKDASPEGFGVQAAHLEYVCQAAYYVDGYEAITRKLLPYFVVAVETAEPYVVQVYEVGADLLARGRSRYRELLTQLVDCRQANHWPGYGQGPKALTLPSWALSQPEDETGLGLVFGGAS